MTSAKVTTTSAMSKVKLRGRTTTPDQRQTDHASRPPPTIVRRHGVGLLDLELELLYEFVTCRFIMTRTEHVHLHSDAVPFNDGAFDRCGVSGVIWGDEGPDNMISVFHGGDCRPASLRFKVSCGIPRKCGKSRSNTGVLD